MKKIKIFAFISAVITALLLLVYLNSLKKPVEIDKTTVVVAVVNIPANTPIAVGMIQETELPTQAVLPDAIPEASMVIGKIAKTEMFAGEQLLQKKLISPGESKTDSLAYAIEPGMRAITISVNETSGLAYMLTPGNRIDLIGEYMYAEKNQLAGSNADNPDGALTPASKEEPKSYTVMILENVTVLAADRELSEKGKGKSENPAYTTITLQVTPRQAMELSMAQFEGQLRAILRSPLDQEYTNLPNVTLEDIIEK